MSDQNKPYILFLGTDHFLGTNHFLGTSKNLSNLGLSAIGKLLKEIPLTGRSAIIEIKSIIHRSSYQRELCKGFISYDDWDKFDNCTHPTERGSIIDEILYGMVPDPSSNETGYYEFLRKTNEIIKEWKLRSIKNQVPNFGLATGFDPRDPKEESTHHFYKLIYPAKIVPVMGTEIVRHWFTMGADVHVLEFNKETNKTKIKVNDKVIWNRIVNDEEAINFIWERYKKFNGNELDQTLMLVKIKEIAKSFQTKEFNDFNHKFLNICKELKLSLPGTNNFIKHCLSCSCDVPPTPIKEPKPTATKIEIINPSLKQKFIVNNINGDFFCEYLMQWDPTNTRFMYTHEKNVGLGSSYTLIKDVPNLTQEEAIKEFARIREEAIK